jgi:hypothetical protein
MANLNFRLSDGSTATVVLSGPSDPEEAVTHFLHFTDEQWVQVENGYVRRDAIIHVWAGAPPVGDLLPRANR